MTVSSDQAKKEKSQDDTSGRPRFQKKSCTLEGLIAVKIKRRDYHALNSISIQGRRILWCCFEIFGQVHLIPSEKYKRSYKTRKPEKRRNLPLASYANESSPNSESDISFFQFKGAKKGWVMLDILSCPSYCPKILFPNPWVAYELINFYISSSYPPMSSSYQASSRRAGGSGDGGGLSRGRAEEKRGSGGGHRGPPAGSAPGHRTQGALAREEERGFRGGRSYSDNQR